MRLLRSTRLAIQTSIRFNSTHRSQLTKPSTIVQRRNPFSTGPISKMAHEYRLTLPPSTLKPGTKHESEIDGIPNTKLLLVNTGTGIHALSPRCTHYGAPLVKGVLDAKSGRLTCPWHGACFAVATGDVEDAPALDPLLRFDVVEREGALWVTGEEEVIKGRKRTL